jgi:hypothetical protein
METNKFELIGLVKRYKMSEACTLKKIPMKRKNSILININIITKKMEN